MMERIRIFLYRASLGVTCIWGLILMPLPLFIADSLPAKNVAVTLGGVLWMGKLILDTFFYDHYQP
ncbi:MAG: hypothetical protein IT210_08915 [Armatimonadetes bacterium]|nr:hypothetical protein [Armatimonadota bacterium]